MLRKFIVIAGALVAVGCANMQVAHFSINPTTYRNAKSAATKKIVCVIDPGYLESKYVDFFHVTHDNAGLKAEREQIFKGIKDKIRGSLPDNITYREALPDPIEGFESAFRIEPVLRTSVMEEGGRVETTCSIKVRVYDASMTRVNSIGIRTTTSEPYAGSFSWIGSMEYYKTFQWQDELVPLINKTINDSLDAAVKELSARVTPLQ